MTTTTTETATATSLVCVETLSPQRCEMHRAAGKRMGRYPYNGAERQWVDADEAEALIQGDVYEYAHIVNKADLL